MTPPPRKTKVPAHIDQNRLPAGIWWSTTGNGRWMLKYKDGAKWRSKRIAGPTATLAELHKLVEDRNATGQLTFAALSAQFQQTAIWRKLAISTQLDYLDCHTHICKTLLDDDKTLGDAPIDAWTIGLVREYRDSRGESSESRANKELAYIKRLFSWAYEYERVEFDPAKAVKKFSIKPRQHYAEDKDYEFMLAVATASNYWYAPLCMEIAYRCRMRLSEVLDLTDANERADGLLVKRRKGSRDNIVSWTPTLRTVWQTAVNKRNEILSDRKQPHPIKPECRFIFISERTGDKIQVSSLKTALSRIGTEAEAQAKRQGIDFIRFTFHDLKRKGVSDTEGNKQEASGHRTASMLNIYDVKLATVKPAGEK